MTPAEALRQGREQIGMSRADLQKLLGISYGYLTDMERGARAFPDKYLPMLPEGMREIVREALVERERAAIGERREKIRRMLEE